MDVDGIDPGRDFRKVIDETLIQCDVLLGVIGKNWLDTKDETGRRRLDDASDFVRLEIASALRRDIPVIPVRVQGASIPKPDQLPDDLKDFSYRNSVELTHERWNSDVQVLVDKLRRVMTAPPSQGANQNPRPEPSYVAPPPPMPERQQTPFSAAVAPAVTKRFPKEDREVVPGRFHGHYDAWVYWERRHKQRLRRSRDRCLAGLGPLQVVRRQTRIGGVDPRVRIGSPEHVNPPQQLVIGKAAHCRNSRF